MARDLWVNEGTPANGVQQDRSPSVTAGKGEPGGGYRLMEAVEGRTDDVLSLPARTGGLVRVHPVIFHQTLDLIDAAGWQVHQHRAGLHILVASPGPSFDRAATEDTVRAALIAAGASTPQVTVSAVGEIPSGAAGKRPLVVASPPDPLPP